MDTLSATSTTTGFFKLPTSTSRELHHAATTTTSLLLPPHQHYHLSSAPKSAGSKRRSFTSSASTPAVVLSTKSHLKPPPVPFHRKAASGYAAALLDSAQFGGSAALSAVARDGRRFSKVLKREEIRDFICNSSTEEIDKAGVMKSIAEKGRFHAQLKALLNLLIEKGKVGILGEVLDEFDRIYQLLGHGVGIGVAS